MSKRNNSFRPWREDELTDWWFMNVGDGKEGTSEYRSWEDCQKYGFMIAGGKPEFIEQIKKLHDEYPVLAYEDESGFVGAGIVRCDAVPQKEFRPYKSDKTLVELSEGGFLKTPYDQERLDAPEPGDEDDRDWCVKVEWLHPDRDRSNGVLGKESDCRPFNRRGAVHRFGDDKDDVVRASLEAMGVDPDTFNGRLRAAA